MQERIQVIAVWHNEGADFREVSSSNPYSLTDRVKDRFSPRLRHQDVPGVRGPRTDRAVAQLLTLLCMSFELRLRSFAGGLC